MATTHSKCLHEIGRFLFSLRLTSESQQESRAVAGNPRDAAVIFDP